MIKHTQTTRGYIGSNQNGSFAGPKLCKQNVRRNVIRNGEPISKTTNVCFFKVCFTLLVVVIVNAYR